MQKLSAADESVASEGWEEEKSSQFN